jgi:hypothetical protein
VYDSIVWNRAIETVDLPSSILIAMCDVNDSEPLIPLSQHRVYRICKKRATSKTVKKGGMTAYSYPSMKSRFAIPGLEVFGCVTEPI